MNFKHHARAARRAAASVIQNPNANRRLINHLPAIVRGEQFAQAWQSSPPVANTVGLNVNPLRAYFEAHQSGPGILKWEHYFDAYHRHCQKFIGQEIHLLEVGIYSGGSLGMWKSYFGPGCHVYGVDIEPDCKVYEGENVRVFIGDQGSSSFWRDFKKQVPRIDFIVDDGSHLPEHQIITMEEMLPHLSRGGVYACEDAHGAHQDFTAFMEGLINNLFTYNHTQSPDATHPYFAAEPTSFQKDIHSISQYPYLTIIEKYAEPLKQLLCPKHGTEWQPFPFEKKVTRS